MSAEVAESVARHAAADAWQRVAAAATAVAREYREGVPTPTGHLKVTAVLRYAKDATDAHDTAVQALSR